VRRAGLLVLAVLVALAGVVGLVAFLQSRDESTVDQSEASAPGVADPALTQRALAQGNVILTYRQSGQREQLRALAEEIAGPPDQALVHAGQAVLVQARPSGGGGVVAQAFERRFETATPDDPQLRDFVEYWLGRAQASP
jgi:hypothetical protein